MRPFAAWCALLSFVMGMLVPVSIPAHAPDDVDAAWGAGVLLARGDGIDRIAPPQAPAGEEHCAVCHWLRALNHSVRGANIRGPQFDLVRHRLATPIEALNARESASAPARAPPFA